MKQKYHQLAAYVIHTRPFRETSLLIELFSEQLGRCSAVAKGVYRGKAPIRNLLQIFNLLSVSLQGNNDLLNLTQIERIGLPYYISGQALVCGLYLNELLYYTLHRYDPHPNLFTAYRHALSQLSTGGSSAISLREFEFILLEELGYGINFECIEIEKTYFYIAGQGFRVVTHEPLTPQYCFSGAKLLAISAKQWHDPEVLLAAKSLTQVALGPLLAGKEIRSRELW